MNDAIRKLERIQSELECARADCMDEEGQIRDGHPADANSLDGAIVHAETALRNLRELRDSLSA